uniref:Uncharacterized protein n=1 Tax=Anopheles albimanus TaxID=7167 RepID=A0A182FXF6_ANOAL
STSGDRLYPINLPSFRLFVLSVLLNHVAKTLASGRPSCSRM